MQIIIHGERIKLIKENKEQLVGRYDICLNNNDMVIGYILYRGYNQKYIGDIGYFINSNYRGFNYGYEALCLLSNHLQNNNIKEFWLYIENDNKESIKLVQKYGIEELVKQRKILKYKCKTK